MMFAIPELTTERLRLRGWTLADFVPYAEYSADAEWNRYRHDGLDRVAAWNEFSSMVGQWGLRGYGAWALERRIDEMPIGYAGFWHPIDIETAELYWGLYREAAGQGYATEAARALLTWWGGTGRGSLVTYCHPDNFASRRLAERLGGVAQGTAMLRGRECQLFSYPLPRT